MNVPALVGSTLQGFQFVQPTTPRKLKLHIINTWHSGDALLTRPIIKVLQPHFDLTLECTQAAAYLWADLGLPVFPGQPDNPFHTSALRPPDAIGVNLWFGTYDPLLRQHGMTIVNQAHTFNRRMMELGIPWKFEIPTEPPPVDFKPVPMPAEVQIKPRSVLVENGAAKSNQSVFEINPVLAQLVADFPDIHFYCSSPPPCTAPNLTDLSALNLIQLSQVGDQCLGFVTRGSGVNAACYTRTSMWKPRCILGWTYGMLIWHNKAEWLYSYEEMRDFVRRAVPAVSGS